MAFDRRRETADPAGQFLEGQRQAEADEYVAQDYYRRFRDSDLAFGNEAIQSQIRNDTLRLQLEQNSFLFGQQRAAAAQASLPRGAGGRRFSSSGSRGSTLPGGISVGGAAPAGQGALTGIPIPTPLPRPGQYQGPQQQPGFPEFTGPAQPVNPNATPAPLPAPAPLPSPGAGSVPSANGGAAGPPIQGRQPGANGITQMEDGSGWRLDPTTGQYVRVY